MLSSSEIIDLKYKNGVATLTINEVFPEDEGEYACLATNSIGSDTTSCKLTIKRKNIYILININLKILIQFNVIQFNVLKIF